MGSVLSLLEQNFPPRAQWSIDQIPDLSGKVVVVTGGNVGIGLETIRALLQHNAKVYMASRDSAKANKAIAELKEETGKEAIFLQLDLADLSAIKAAVDRFKSLEKELHILFNNGGVMLSPLDMVTKDGYDLQFGTNVLGHYYLTTLLLPELEAGAKASSDHIARVVNVSSLAHVTTSTIKWETLSDGPARKKLTSLQLYSQSKFGNILFSNELAKRYGEVGIVSTSLHPGIIRTELVRHLPTVVQKIVHWTCFPPSQGALTQLYAGTAPETASANGKYFTAWARIGKASEASNDRVCAEKLWAWLEEQVKKT